MILIINRILFIHLKLSIFQYIHNVLKTKLENFLKYINFLAIFSVKEDEENNVPIQSLVNIINFDDNILDVSFSGIRFEIETVGKKHLGHSEIKS